MDPITENFHLKNADGNYIDGYVEQHMPRVEWVIKRFGLDSLSGQRIVDIGCGRGMYFAKMRSDNFFVGIDGAIIPPQKKLVPFLSLRSDFNNEDFGILFDNDGPFDWLIASEVLEHVGNLNNLMLGMKRLLKIDGYAIFTVPDISVWHPTIFPGVFFPPSNFRIFVEQYAFLVEEADIYTPTDGWKAICFKVKNHPMKDARPLFPKPEAKFVGATPEQYTNL